MRSTVHKNQIWFNLRPTIFLYSTILWKMKSLCIHLSRIHSSQQTQWNEANAIRDNFVQTTVFNHLKPRLGALFKGMWERIKLLGWTWGRTWQRTWCRPWRMGGLIIQNTNNKEKNNNNCYTSNYNHIVIVIAQLKGYIPFQVKWFCVSRETCNMVAMPFPYA